MKLASLLPPKRSDPSADFKPVQGAVEEQEERNSGGSGHVQDVEVVKGRADEFGSHTLPPFEDDDISDDDEPGGSGGAAGCVIM